MSQAPHRVPPPPKPTPDNPFELQPVQQSVHERDLTAEILTISVIVAGLVLLGVGTMLWVRDNRPAAPPATATATRSAYVIASPTAAEFSTSQADSLRTPSPRGTVSAPVASSSPTSIAANAATPGIALPLVAGNSGRSTSVAPQTGIFLPDVSGSPDGGQDRDTSTPAVGTPIPGVAPTSTPVVETQALRNLALPYLAMLEAPPTPVPPTPTASPTPTITPIVVATLPTAIGGTPPGTPVAEPTQAPTGLPLVISEMSARMSRTADFHLGPSAIYTATDSLNTGEEITLYGRDRSGDWLYACCVDDDDDDDEQNDVAWVRQASVIIEGNELEGEDEEDEDYIDRNDARWLPIVSARPDLRLLPTVTPPPSGDFPLFRYIPDNRGFVPNLPNLATTTRLWSSEPEAGGALTAPLVVLDSLVYGASSDGHIYSWDIATGSQRARRLLDASVTSKPAVDDGLLYIVDASGLLHALQDPIDQDAIWRSDLNVPPNGDITGINVYSHTLFINMSGRISVVDGETGEIRHEVSLPANPIYPTIGGQLLYVVADAVRAYDALMMIENNSTQIVWERSQIPAGVAPAVYTANGVESLAELYVAGGNNRIYSLDANTGDENWNDDNEEAITGLALGETALYISGDNYVKARSRETPEEDIDPVFWRTPVAGPILGGPLVGPDAVLVILQNGNILYLDAATGEIRGTYQTYPALPSSAGAVSSVNVLVPAENGRLYGYRQSP